MPIRRRFAATITAVLIVLTSGTVSLAAPEFLPVSTFEEPGHPVVYGGVLGLDLSLEPLVEEGGSASREAATWVPRIDVDPWAEAFAESSRLTRAAVPASVTDGPVYHVPINQQVQYFLDRFTRERRWVVDRWFGRAGRYLEMIRETLRQHGLPEDLAFVAMIESGFNPVAVSRAGAKGLWQFMAGTARRYGLRVDQWVDERFDPEKSTLAAAAYLRDLYAQFGSWSLAQAAYNAGEQAVARAIRAAGSTDFWTLARSSTLKQETKEFVPQIQAATVIGQDPARYGFDIGGHGPATFELVSIPPATNLATLAKAAGVSLDTLKTLNPVLVKGVTPPGAPYQLRVPAGTGDAVHAAVRVRPTSSDPRRSSATTTSHVVRAGETVGEIAKRYGVTVRDLQGWNHLPPGDLIHPGDRLVVADSRHWAAPRGRSASR